MKNYQIVEYSVSQKCFHTHTLLDMMKVNIGSIIQNKSSDYLPIGIFDTYDEASDFIKVMREKFENKTKTEVSNCCQATMIEPDWESAENAGSLYRAYVCYICNNCGKPCEPIIQEKKTTKTKLRPNSTFLQKLNKVKQQYFL